jgi:hypothetical protein
MVGPAVRRVEKRPPPKTARKSSATTKTVHLAEHSEMGDVFRCVHGKSVGMEWSCSLSPQCPADTRNRRDTDKKVHPRPLVKNIITKLPKLVLIRAGTGELPTTHVFL